MEEIFSTSSILDPTTPISGLTPYLNHPDISPSFGPLTPNASIETGLRQSTMENFTTTNYSLPLMQKEKKISTTLPEGSNDSICEIESPNNVIYVHSPSSPEDILPLAPFVKTTASLNGSEIKTTLTTPLVMWHKLPHNLIASAMDWLKRTSKTTFKPKDEFIKFLRDNMIIYNRHYKLYLSNYHVLPTLETIISINSLESLKKTIFRQSYLVIQNSNLLENRVNIKSVNHQDCEMGLVNFFLKQIADENQIAMESFKNQLGMWLFNRNHKTEV